MSIPRKVEITVPASNPANLTPDDSPGGSTPSPDPSSEESSSRQGSSPNIHTDSTPDVFPRAEQHRAGGMSQSSSQNSSGGSNTNNVENGNRSQPSGTKTPRKNVQWAASTKGEGPTNAVAQAHVYLQELHRRGKEGEDDGHVHLLDEEGLDPEAFQTLTHALERHQSSSHDNSPSTHPHSHPTVRRDFATSLPAMGNSNGGGSANTNKNQGGTSGFASSRPEFRQRRTEPPRLTSLPPNPFSPPTSGNTNAGGRDSYALSNLNEIFTPTTLSPIHSDAGTDTDENMMPERNMPGEAFIESTETHGLPQPLPPSTANAVRAGEGGKSGIAGRFSLFPFRSGSTNKDEAQSSQFASSSPPPPGQGGKAGDGILGAINSVEAEEEEKRRIERRATKLVRAHARGFQFLSGFKGNKAMQRLAPEDIDAEAPLPRRPTRFTRSADNRSRRRRPQSAPASAEKSSESSPDKDEQNEGYGLFSRFRKRTQGHGEETSLDEDVEDTAALAQAKNAPLALGSGVLSALLTLYDRPAGGMRSGFSTPGDRTPSGSEPASPESESFGHGYFSNRKKEDSRSDYFGKQASRREGDQRSRDKGVRNAEGELQVDELERINTRLNSGNMFDSAQERERFERERESERKLESVGTSSEELTPPHPLYARKSGSRSLQSLKIKDSFNELTRTMSGGIERIKEKTSPTRLAALPLPRIPLIGGDSLPSGARSGAGVFGSLIASTNNLTGIAAPEPSRIAPNPKKPGFHLNRYSYSEEAADTDADMLKRAKKAFAAGFRTPGNTPRSSIAMNRSDIGMSNWAALGSGSVTPSESLLALSMSRSAPTTPAGELPPSIFVAGTGDTPSPASDGSPASATPLMGASRNDLDSPAVGGSANGHSPSRSLDSSTPVTERPPGFAHARTQSDTLSLTTIPTRGSVSTSTTLNGLTTPGRRKWAGILKDFQKHGNGSESRSGAATPETISEAGSHDYLDEKHRRWVNASIEEKRKRKRKKAEIFITRHVAEIMQRQEFILKLARAFMMFGAPSHRLPAQIQATARVLDMELSCMYLPDVMLISFDDAATSTSNIKFIRQGAALSLGKLQEAYDLYWKVIHDEIGVGEASRALDALMQQRPPYSTWQLALFGGFCSAAICEVSFSGSFIDSLIAFPLGMLLVLVQTLSVRNELYSNVFEITITTLLSFMAAVFAGTHHFCYSAVASGSIVLILPGFLVLNGSLELSSRNMVSGAVRLCYAIMYALFLGFGLSIGGTLYEKFTGKAVSSPEDYTCGSSHNANGPWYERTPSGLWAFLTVPMFSLFLTLRNQAPWRKKELLVTVAISCVGWTCNHFSAVKFPNRSDVSSAIGAFSVGFIANLYGRFFSGNAFVIMITGILFQLPSGLGNGGLITFASQNNSAGTTTSYLSGFKTALQLISVSVGLTVGLGISLVVLYPIQSRKRAGGIFSL